MARDDSLLYTGATSASFRTKRELTNEEKLEQKGHMIPAAKIVFDLIEKEKVNVADISTLLITAETDLEAMKADLLARRLYTTYLSELQNKLKIILRAKPKAQK